MKLDEAKRLIGDLFDHQYDPEKYHYFLKSLLKSVEEKPFSRSGNLIPTQFRDFVSKFDRIGKFTDTEGQVIDLLVVRLHRNHSVEWARSTQRNFIRWYLNGSMGDVLKDAALVAFYSENNPEWRFSFIKMQYSLEKKKDELTPAKRYSFLLGERGKSHTAQRQLVGLLKNNESPTLDDIEDAFNIEAITEEFFKEYKRLVFDIAESVEKLFKTDKNIAREFDQKQINVLDFSKKLLGQIVFLYFLQRKGWLGLKGNQSYGEGDRSFLRSLFQMAKPGENFFNDYLEFLFYDALSRKRVTDTYSRFNCRIPFLNGGLFDPINFYDWDKTDILIPNNFFSNTDENDTGDIGTGILDVFDRFNFTVNEDEPLEKEVAVDPEMLGKVFERMLEVTERKSKGAFYTPREEVHYMSQESLIHYLSSALEGKVPLHDIEIFIKHAENIIDKDAAILEGRLTETNNKFNLPNSILKHAKLIDDKLRDVRVCDPAVGSGAFPVAVMMEIVKARSILHKIMFPGKEPNHYEFKNHAIHHCLYGVDIDSSAVEICKLRLWLSLIVDEQRIDVIDPLPNLDYKIVRGNSLINLPNDVFPDQALQRELDQLKGNFYDETDKKSKQQLKVDIDSKIKKLLRSAAEFTNYPITFDFNLFFHEVFNEKGGFDIIIGNPPYVPGKNLSISQKSVLKKIFQYHSGKFDLYLAFIERSLSLKSKEGSIILIIPNTFLVNENATLLRRHLIEYKMVIKIRTFVDPVFDADVENIIIHISKNQNTLISCFDDYGKQFDQLSIDDIRKDSFYRLQITSSLEDRILLDKIEHSTLELGNITDMCIGIQLGGAGDSKLFKNRFISKEPKNDHYKPVLDGKEFVPFKTSWSGNYVYYGNWLHRKRNEKYFINPKLIIRQIGNTPIINIDLKGYYTLNTIYNVITLNSNYPLKVLFAIINSKVIKYYWSKKFSDSKTLFPKIKKSQLVKIPIKINIPIQLNKMLETTIDFLLFLKSNSFDDKYFKLFEQLTDSLIMELYFNNQIKSAGCEILKHLTGPTPITEAMTDDEKMRIITQTYNELSNPAHPVAQNLKRMDEIEEVRIIKGLDQP